MWTTSQAACNEGKSCCLLSNFLENPENASHLTTMVVGKDGLARRRVEVTRMMDEAVAHYLKGGYTEVALGVGLSCTCFHRPSSSSSAST